jgi:hypothetical protein
MERILTGKMIAKTIQGTKDRKLYEELPRHQCQA